MPMQISLLVAEYFDSGDINEAAEALKVNNSSHQNGTCLGSDTFRVSDLQPYPC